MMGILICFLSALLLTVSWPGKTGANTPDTGSDVVADSREVVTDKPVLDLKDRNPEESLERSRVPITRDFPAPVVLIQVLDELERQIPGVEVHYRRLDGALRPLEAQYTANENGLVRMEVEAGVPFYVWSRWEDSWGDRRIHPDEMAPGEVIDLILKARATQVVVVKDDIGRPVPNVFVSLHNARQRGRWTDEEGKAHLGFPSSVGRVQPVAWTVSEKFEGEVIDVEAGHAEIVIQVPRLTQTRVRVIDPSGGDTDSDFALKVDVGSPRRRLVKAFSGPSTQIAVGEPGQQVRLALRESGRAESIHEFELPNLEFHEVRLQRSSALARVVVRLDSSDGGALARHWVTVVKRFDVGESSTEQRIRADAEGRLVVLVPPNRAGSIQLRSAFGRSRTLTDAQTLEIGVPPTLPDDLYDAGTLRLNGTVPLLTGRVVGPTGGPVEGALVRVSFTGDPDQFSRLRKHTDEQVWAIRDLEAVSGPDGEFSVHSSPQLHLVEPLAVWARKANFVSDEIDAGPEEEVTLELHEAGGFEGMIVGPAEMLKTIDVEYFPHEDRVTTDLPAPYRGYTRPRSDGRFVRWGLFPGEYCVRVVIDGLELIRFESVAIEEGKLTRQAQMQEILLENLLADGHVRVTGPDGPVSNARVSVERTLMGQPHVRAVGGRWFAVKTTNLDGVARFFVSRTSLYDVRVDAPELGVRRYSNVNLPLHVVFADADAARIEVFGITPIISNQFPVILLELERVGTGQGRTGVGRIVLRLREGEGKHVASVGFLQKGDYHARLYALREADAAPYERASGMPEERVLKAMTRIGHSVRVGQIQSDHGEGLLQLRVEVGMLEKAWGKGSRGR